MLDEAITFEFPMVTLLKFRTVSFEKFCSSLLIFKLKFAVFKTINLVVFEKYTCEVLF